MSKKRKISKKQKEIVWKKIAKWRKEARSKYIGLMSCQNETECFLYVAKFYDEKEVFIKVGISIDIEQRFERIPYDYKLLIKERLTMDRAFDLENKLVKTLYFKNAEYRPLKYFSGITECYSTSAAIITKNILADNYIFRI